MRYVTLRISTTGGTLRTIPRSGFPTAVERGPVHRIESLADGSAVQIRSVRGDLAAYRDLLAANEAVHVVSIVDGPRGHVFAHFEPTETARAVLEWRRRFPIVVQTPITFDRGDPIVTVVGDGEGVSDATDALPDAVQYDVRETGRFSPRWAAPFRGLTERQREILETAVELGYYENPRAATQADVADAVSLAPGTVGDHLRTVEAHVFARYARSIADPRQ